MNKNLQKRLVRVASVLEKLAYGEGISEEKRKEKEVAFGKDSLHLLPKDLRKKIKKQWLEPTPFMGKQGLLLKHNADPELMKKIYNFWKEWNNY